METVPFPGTVPFPRSADFLISCMEDEIRGALNCEFANGFPKPPFRNHDLNYKLDYAATDVCKAWSISKGYWFNINYFLLEYHFYFWVLFLYVRISIISDGLLLLISLWKVKTHNLASYFLETLLLTQFVNIVNKSICLCNLHSCFKIISRLLLSLTFLPFYVAIFVGGITVFHAKKVMAQKNQDLSISAISISQVMKAMTLELQAS